MRFIKYLLLILLIPLIAIILLWFNLEKVAQPQLLKHFNTKYLPQLEVNWEKTNFTIDNRGWFKKTFHIDSSDSCLSYDFVKICYRKILIEFDINPIDLFNSLKIKKAVLDIISGSVDLTKIESSEDTKPYFSLSETVEEYFPYIAQVKHYTPNDFSIKMDQLDIITEDSTFKIKTHINTKLFNSSVRSNSLSVNIDLKKAKSDSYEGLVSYQDNQQKITAQMKAEITNSVFANMEIDYNLISPKTRKKIDFINPRIAMTMDFKVSQDELKLNILKSQVDFKKYINKIELNNCLIDLSFKSDEFLELECPDISLSSNFENRMNEMWFFKARLSGKIKERLDFGPQLNPWGELKAQINNTKPDFVKMKAKTQVNFGYNKEFYYKLNQLDSQLDIDNYQRLVKILKKTAYAIPAPFNTLKGTISAQSTTDLENLSKKSKIFFEAETKLDGEGEFSFHSQMEGHYFIDSIKNKNQLEAKALIERLYVYIPPFDPIKEVPRVINDSRVKKTITAEKKKKAKNPFRYKISVKTKNSDSFRLYYKLFKPYLSTSINMNLGHDQTQFDIDKTDEFSINYLKRSVVVKKFNISQKEKSSTLPLEVRFLYQASGYDIFIDIIGTLDKPRVILSSYPSLPRKDIISLLIYNRLSSEVSSFESESIGSTEAAIADRAIGLIGIWAFASTPIEAVSYNPQKKIYSAQISLPGDIKFNIGTNWEKVQSLSLRKRIAKTWSIVTSFDPGEEEEDMGTFFLQKEINY